MYAGLDSVGGLCERCQGETAIGLGPAIWNVEGNVRSTLKDGLGMRTLDEPVVPECGQFTAQQIRAVATSCSLP